MTALIALLIQILIPLVKSGDASVVIIPSEEQQWDEFYQDAYEEFANEFSALFNSYEVKRAKNNALMIRRGSSGSYTFAKKG